MSVKETKRDKKYPKQHAQSGIRVGTLEEEMRILLGQLCTEWGFCIPPADIDELSGREKITASEFAKGVLDAEGLDSLTSPWFKKIERRFIDTFGDYADSRTHMQGQHPRLCANRKCR